MEYIRKTYNVPAKRGARIEYMGGGYPRKGTITSSRGAHLWIRLDGLGSSSLFHPTWMLRYLEPEKVND